MLLLMCFCHSAVTTEGDDKAWVLTAEVIEGLFFLFMWKVVFWIIPPFGKMLDGYVQQFFSEGIFVILLMGLFFAPWCYTFIKIRDDAGYVVSIGWICLSAALNIALATLMVLFL